MLRFSDLSLDPVTREANRGDRSFTLTRIEYDLLELLLRHPRQVLTRELILDRVWGYTFDSGTNSLAVYIGYLRRKTEDEGEPRLIHTARGVGYVLREPVTGDQPTLRDPLGPATAERRVRDLPHPAGAGHHRGSG